IGERVHGGDLAMIFIFVIAGGVLLCAAYVVSGLLVVEHGDAGKGLVLTGQERSRDGGVEGRGVDEGLEDGASGALGHGVIQLASAVIAAADEGQYLASVGVEGNERNLRVLDGRLGLGYLGL